MISQFIGCVSVTVCLILVVIIYWRIYIILKWHKNQIEEPQIQEVQQGVQNGDLSNFFIIRGSPFKFNLLLQCLDPSNDFVSP